MSVINDLNQSWEERAQREDTFAARAALENWTNVTHETLDRLQEIIESGHFGTIPAELKACLQRWRQIPLEAKAKILADPEIIDAHQWRP